MCLPQPKWQPCLVQENQKRRLRTGFLFLMATQRFAEVSARHSPRVFFVYLLQQQGASVKGCTHRCNAFSGPVPHTTRTQDRMCMYYVSDYSKKTTPLFSQSSVCVWSNREIGDTDREMEGGKGPPQRPEPLGNCTHLARPKSRLSKSVGVKTGRGVGRTRVIEKEGGPCLDVSCRVGGQSILLSETPGRSGRRRGRSAFFFFLGENDIENNRNQTRSRAER